MLVMEVGKVADEVTDMEVDKVAGHENNSGNARKKTFFYRRVSLSLTIKYPPFLV